MSTHTSIIIYGNMLISSEERLRQLKFVAPSWLKYWDCRAIIRVRGEYARAAADFLQGFPGVATMEGQSVKSWRTQALLDLQTIENPYVFILFEDHMLSKNARDSSNILRDITKYECDIYQYSWFPTYAKLRHWQEQQVETKKTESSFITEIDFRLGRLAYKNTNLYLLSLSSIFKKSFLTQRLKSPLPILRRYDPAGPFDIELKMLRRSQTPLVFGQSRQEIGICLDDDHIVAGSSGLARGLIEADYVAEEQHQHYSRRSLFAASRTKKSKLKISRSSKLLGLYYSRTLLRLDWLINSIVSLSNAISDPIRIRSMRQQKINDD